MVSGDIITFIDSDDYIHTEFIETLVEIMSMTKSDIVVCNYTSSDTLSINNTDNITYYNFDTFQSDFFVKSHIWGRIYRSNVIKDVNFPLDIRLGEDTIFNISVMCNNPNIRITKTDKVMYFYRTNNNNSLVHTVEHKNIYKVGLYYFNNFNKLELRKSKNIFLIESIKSFLAFRYLTMFDHNLETKKDCNNKLKILLKEIKKHNDNWKINYIYILFIKFPFYIDFIE